MHTFKVIHGFPNVKRWKHYQIISFFFSFCFIVVHNLKPNVITANNVMNIFVVHMLAIMVNEEFPNHNDRPSNLTHILLIMFP
jgi:hypothetical protein